MVLESMLFKIRKIRKYCESLKLTYINSSPKEKWDLVRKLANFSYSICGVSFIDRKFETTWLSYIVIVLNFDLIASFGYTIWYFSDTPLNGFLMTPLFGIIIPVSYLFYLLFIFFS